MINMIYKPRDEDGDSGNCYIITIEDPDYHDCQLLSHAMDIIDYKRKTEMPDSKNFPKFTDEDLQVASADEIVEESKKVLQSYQLNREVLKLCKHIIINKLKEGADPEKLLVYACKAITMLDEDDEFLRTVNSALSERNVQH